MRNDKPNIVRVKRDTWAFGNTQFYKVMLDKPTDDEFVTNKDGEHYTYITAVDELDAWALVQRMLDVQYGKD